MLRSLTALILLKLCYCHEKWKLDQDEAGCIKRNKIKAADSEKRSKSSYLVTLDQHEIVGFTVKEGVRQKKERNTERKSRYHSPRAWLHGCAELIALILFLSHDGAAKYLSSVCVWLAALKAVTNTQFCINAISSKSPSSSCTPTAALAMLAIIFNPNRSKCAF